MTLVIVLAVIAGLGVILIVRGLFPPPLTLGASLDILSGRAPGLDPGDGATDRTSTAKRMASRAVYTNVDRAPKIAAVLVPDLAVTGTPKEVFAMKVAGYGITLAVIPPLAVAAMATFGNHINILVPIVGMLVLGPLGAALPFFDIHKSAEIRRAHFLHTLSSYTSLVSMAIASSMGWLSALEVASSVSSSDWAMIEIRQALLWSQTHHRPPWEGFSDLARRFAIPEMADLARSMAQAGEGAKIRDTLETKSESLRQGEAIALEQGAQAVTQKMLFPGIFLLLGYGILIFYPAISSILGAHA
jgi:hypothetical protein